MWGDKMKDLYEDIQKKYFIAFVQGIKNVKEINLNENFQLIKFVDAIKLGLIENIYNDLEKEMHCMVFTFNYSFIRNVGKNIPQQNLRHYSVDFWAELGEKDLEEEVHDDALTQLVTFVDAINIYKRNPCQILRIDLYDEGIFLYNKWTADHPLNFHEIMGCNLIDEDIKPINSIFSKILDAGPSYFQREKKYFKRYWWMIALDYFLRSPISFNTADQLVDLTIGLESLLSGDGDTNEMRFRISQRSSLYLYHINHYCPIQVQQLVKKMYDIRSKIVHGSKGFGWALDYDNIKVMDEEISIPSALYMLREVIRVMLCDAIINHSEKNKDKFIEKIDTSWYDKRGSKINFI